MKYFEETQEYPRNVAFNPLPWNICYEYVSSTFLNGFINYVKIKKAYLISRYTAEDELVQNVDIIDPPGSYNWIKFSGTKKEVFDKITTPGAIVHSHLDDFGDDVLILAKIEKNQDEKLHFEQENTNFYMFFWYDCDCSDCCIGRFYTDDTEAQVIQEFDVYVKDRHDKMITTYQKQDAPLREIPITYFKGWMSG